MIVAEPLIVAGRRGLDAKMSALLDELNLKIASVPPTTAEQVADAYAQ